jgi:hypothetical protein
MAERTPEEKARAAAAAKRWRERHPERAREVQRRHYEANRTSRSAAANRAGQARWAAMTPEARLEHGRNRRKREADANRERKRAEFAALRAEVIAAYGGRCACCGNDFRPHLAIDHIDGGGAEERRQATSSSIYRRLRRAARAGRPDPGYQVLCHNCNMAKHWYGRCCCQEREPFEATREPRVRGVI